MGRGYKCGKGITRMNVVPVNWDLDSYRVAARECST
jgi:hypothetical protein